MDDTDIGVFETTKRQLCYTCTVEGKSEKKNKKDIETLMEKYG